MSYSRKAYVEFAGMLSAVLDEINLDESVSDEEVALQEKGAARVIEKIAEIFEADNPRGFDKDRFMDEVWSGEVTGS